MRAERGDCGGKREASGGHDHLDLPRHGGRRPAIHDFADYRMKRRKWPTFADHDDGGAIHGSLARTVGVD
jgi:hypothetical protein